MCMCAETRGKVHIGRGWKRERECERGGNSDGNVLEWRRGILRFSEKKLGSVVR